MQRVTISLDDAIAADFDALVRAQGYASRSEAVRDLVRRAVDDRRLEAAAGAACVASLSYVADTRVRALAQRLLDMAHAEHDLVVAATRVVLDHDSTLETMVLRGSTAAVRGFADRVRAERGVRFGMVNLISIAPNDHHHDGAAHSHAHHAHASPHPG